MLNNCEIIAFMFDLAENDGLLPLNNRLQE